MQQITKVNLKAVKKCDQVWDDMKTIPGGRQCELCQKKITDFREKSLKEIAKIHVYSDEPVCGIYTEHQLRNEENPVLIEPTSWWSTIKSTYLSLVSFLITLTVSAQDSKVVQKTKVEQSEKDVYKNEKTFKSNKNQYIIKGIISDYANRKLQYANLVIKKDSTILTGVSTDLNGFYELNISSIIDELPDKFRIEISNIGYPTDGIILDKSNFRISSTYNNLFFYRLNKSITHPVLGTHTINPIASSFYAIQRPEKPNKMNWLKRTWTSIKSIFTEKKK